MALQAVQEIITEFTVTNKKKSHYVNRKLILSFREASLTNVLERALEFMQEYWQQFQSKAELLYHSL
jgi:hypothetical protein